MATPTPSGAVAEYQSLSRDLFEREIMTTGNPAVIRGQARNWPAVQAGQEDSGFVRYLLGFDEGKDFKVVVAPPEADGRIFYNPALSGFNFQRQLGKLPAVLGRMLELTGAPSATAVVLQSAILDDYLPGFSSENRLDLLDEAVKPRIWINNPSRVAAHYDPQDNLAVCVSGKRRFTLFPPQAVENLYVGPLDKTPAGAAISLVDVARPDLEKFPAYRDALKMSQATELDPGDVLYIPALWWHAVEALEPINTLVNYWWPGLNQLPGESGMPFDSLLHALLTIRDLPEVQRKAWRAMFDHYVFLQNGDPGAHLPKSARGVLDTLDATKRLQLRQHLKKKMQ